MEKLENPVYRKLTTNLEERSLETAQRLLNSKQFYEDYIFGKFAFC